MHSLPNLPPALARETFARLCAALPPPATDTAEARTYRDNDAMEALAVLRPADAFEARLAVDGLPPGLTRWSPPPTPTPWTASASPPASPTISPPPGAAAPRPPR